MIISNEYIFVFVPRTGSHSIEAAILENDPGAISVDPGCPPFKWQPYDHSIEYQKPVFAVLRDPVDWILSMYNGHSSWNGSRLNRYSPKLNATNTLNKNDILELWYFLSKWYLQTGCYQQTHWIGKSEVILFDDINEHFDFKIPKLNGVAKTITCLDDSALSLAKEIWKEDFELYAKLKGHK